MRIVMFYHSLVSCWNHGNAHFLRGVVSELLSRGHEVQVLEPIGGWSRTNLVQQHGRQAEEAFQTAFPEMSSSTYDEETLDLDRHLSGADLVLVHEWNTPSLISAVGAHRAWSRHYRLLFHDTHHRSVTAPEEMGALDLRNYDGVLAFGEIIRRRYLEHGWAERAWTWHEAADTRRFAPPERPRDADGDLVWIGNWGDSERAEELDEFLLSPIRELQLEAEVWGVRYPNAALAGLRRAGARYRGWLANHRVSEVFSRFRATVHVPRRPYVETLPGIPTIRPFEAMACGIPLVCSPWEDVEGLFEAGRDYLVARDGAEMKSQLRAVLEDEGLARELAANGLRRIRTRHTCRHRVDELMAILHELNTETAPQETLPGRTA